MADEKAYIIPGEGFDTIRPGALALILADVVGGNTIARIGSTEIQKAESKGGITTYEIFDRWCWGQDTGTTRGRTRVGTARITTSRGGYQLSVSNAPDNDVLRAYSTIEKKDESFKVIGPRELPEVMDGWVVIDVRAPEDFLAGHIPGAINIPIAMLKSTQCAKPPDAKRPLELMQIADKVTFILPKEVVEGFHLDPGARQLIIGASDSGQEASAGNRMAVAMTHEKADTKFGDVSVLAGGIRAWRASGKPLEVRVTSQDKIAGPLEPLRGEFVDLVTECVAVSVVKPGSSDYRVYRRYNSHTIHDAIEGSVRMPHIALHHVTLSGNTYVKTTPRDYWMVDSERKGEPVTMLDAPRSVPAWSIAPSPDEKKLRVRQR
jgi:rhodanese-related sulfurtransferase